MEVRRLTNLARLMGTVLATGVLPSSMLKVCPRVCVSRRVCWTEEGTGREREVHTEE